MKDGTCKFFNGMQNDVCDAGIRYRDVTPEPDRIEGSALRLPCRSKPFSRFTPDQLEEFNKRGTCEKFTEPTDAELAEAEAAIQARIKQFQATIPLISRIKKEHKGQSWKGVEECPVCKGRLHMTHAAYNGHVWGKCETEGCLAWME